MDLTRFFASVRASLFDGTMAQAPVDCIETIMAAFAQYGDGDLRKFAYVLATAHHETGRFRWLREIWGPTPQQRRYEPPGTLAATLGNAQPGDGRRFMGRGFVHITGRRNYADWSRRLGTDLVGAPEKAEQHDIAARILVEGTMLGTFTGRKLADYIGAAGADYAGARRTVNGTDKADLIAGYARQYEAALRGAEWRAAPEPAQPGAEPAPAPALPETGIPVSPRTPAAVLADLRAHIAELETLIGA